VTVSGPTATHQLETWHTHEHLSSGSGMQYTTLGRTGLRVSRIGLGGGGHSRLGRTSGRSEAESIDVVRRALECGVNIIDTAEAYRTETIVGKALRGIDREGVVISSKKSMRQDHTVTPAELRAGLEASLRRLATEYLDIYHLHGLAAGQYDHALGALVPEMLRLKEEGKIRAVGVTEVFDLDRGHQMLQRALKDDCWEVIMVGFNMLNQSGRERVIETAIRKNIGVLCMFAVRDALSRPEKLKEIVRELLESGQLDSHEIDADDPLGFLLSETDAPNLVDAAYRFCRDEPGMHVVLSGTGDVAHFDQNMASFERPPLPEQIRARLMRMFAGIDTVSGQ
jgi:L-galactose dehydrogenase